jgi:uncharacterized protein YaiI (UPF0178 family)
MNDTTSTNRPIEIFIDADACPVKEEVYRVARRYALKVHVVSNGGVRVPQEPLIAMVIVAEGPDAADNWIVERIASADIVITADIPLADRCLKAGAEVIGPTGRAFTSASSPRRSREPQPPPQARRHLIVPVNPQLPPPRGCGLMLSISAIGAPHDHPSD